MTLSPTSTSTPTLVQSLANMELGAPSPTAARANTRCRPSAHPLPHRLLPLTNDSITHRQGATHPRSVSLQPIATVSITDGVGAPHPLPVFSQPTPGGEPTRRRSPANPLPGPHTPLAPARTPTAHAPPTRVAPTFVGARGRRAGGGLLCRATWPGAAPHPGVARHVVRHSMRPEDSRARGCCGWSPSRVSMATTAGQCRRSPLGRQLQAYQDAQPLPITSTRYLSRPLPTRLEWRSATERLLETSDR